MSAQRLMYMHTIDGKPATWDGQRVVAVDGPSAAGPVMLYRQLRTLTNHIIRQPIRHQRHTFGWCVVMVPR